MSNNIIIEGADLDYFKELVSRGLSGTYGAIGRIQLLPIGDGRIMLEVNGYTSEPIGTVQDSRQTEANEASALKARLDLSDAVEMKVDEPKLTKKALAQRISNCEQRLDMIDAVIDRAESRLGVSLRS